MGLNKITKYVLIASLLVTGVTLMGDAMAQNATQTTTQTTTEANTSVIQVSNSVTVQDYRFSDGTAIITVKADYPQQLVISDRYGGSTTEGASTIPQKRMNIESGKTQFNITTTAFKGYRGVAIGTSGGAVAIVEKTGGFSFTSEYAPSSLAIMLLTGVLTGIGLVLGLSLRNERKYKSQAEREV